MAGGKLISTGVEFPDATTQTTSGLPLTGGTMTGALTTTGFTSTGIDDNATSTAITIDASENVGVHNTNPTAALEVTCNETGALGVNIRGRASDGISTLGLYNNAGTTVQAQLQSASAGTYFSTYVAKPLIFQTNGVEEMRLLSGGGLTFNGDTAAANALDDYEEGTWTPGIAFGDASVGVTYHSQTTGYYTKVGRAVTVHCYVALTNKGTSTGSITITGLPFANKSGSGNNTTAAIWCNGMTGLDTPIAYIGPGNTKFTAHNLATGTVQSFTNSNVANTSDMMLSVTYITA